MKVERNFRLCILLLVLIGAFILALGEESYLFFAAAIAVCGAQWFGAEEWRGMSEGTAKAIVCAAAMVFLLERLIFRQYVVICTAHFLAVSQFVLLWCKPTNRNLMWIILITVAHACVGTVRTVELGYGVCLLLLVLCLSFALILFLIRRESAAAGLDAGLNAKGMSAPSLRIGAAILFGAIVLFFLLPRIQVNMFRQNLVARVQPIAGFSERVTLGELGRIKMSGEKVMDVKLTRDGQPTAADEMNLYWRGAAMDTYEIEDDKWSWTYTKRPYQIVGVHNISRVQRGFARGGGELKQSINLEPLNTRVLFCLYPIRSLKFFGWGEQPWIIYGQTAGMMVTKARRTSMLKYEVVSDVLPIPGRRLFGAAERLDADDLMVYKTLPPQISKRIGDLARKVTAQGKSPKAKAKLIEKYLRSSRQYRYTLDMSSTPNTEPIGDFLFTRRAGHCEYFASAMVIMLRTLGIPSRMVNGFKGGEWNEFGSFYVVRQSHAHSWVEAYFDDTGWLTYDPSPEVEYAPLLATRLTGAVGRLVDYFDVTWVNLFVAYSQEDQKEFFGSALERVMGSRFFEKMEHLVDRGLSPLTGLLSKGTRRGEEEESGIAQVLRASRVFAVLMLTILATGVILWLLVEVIARLVGKWLRLDAPGLLYHRFCVAMAKQGFRRKDWQTPYEFAVEIGAAAPELAQDARAITLQFCRARYGRKELGREQLVLLNERIKRLAGPHR